ncbi:hypothetical protein EV426DRAFT_601364 [Tirmania nivea]|nr:hypothetical protein EV426DRAFT_601364 [Tirmania nivea]
MLTCKKEVENVKVSIGDGIKRIEGWIKTIVPFGVGTVILGLGTLSYKVMIYDVSVNSEMKSFIGGAIAASEEKTKAATKAELDNIRLSLELSIQRQIGEVLKEIRSVVRDEMHHYMRARNGKE